MPGGARAPHTHKSTDSPLQAIRYTYVNLVDLTEGREVEKFASEVALSGYTISTGRFFPREHADAGGLLKKLFRHIDNPRPE